MAIHTITNNTGAQLELWDAGNRLANLANGQSVHTVPITISSVTRAGVGFMNRNGVFMNDDSYSATYVAAAAPNPATVVFTGNAGVVRFT